MEFLLHLKSSEAEYKELDTLYVAVSQANWPMISLLHSIGGKMFAEEKEEKDQPEVHVYDGEEEAKAGEEANMKVEKGRASKEPVGDVAAQYPLYHYRVPLRHRGAIAKASWLYEWFTGLPMKLHSCYQTRRTQPHSTVQH